MKAPPQLAMLMALISVSGQAIGQPTLDSPDAKPPAGSQAWEYTLTIAGYIVPEGTSYVNPIFAADRKWLHLEARYNDEYLQAASLWVGYHFVRGDVSAGDKWEMDIIPMFGGVFGRSNAIAPGGEMSLSYRKKLEASISNEYVFDTASRSANFYYSWPQLTYSPVEWFHVGAAAQHTAAYQTSFSIQRGFLVGFSRKKWELTTYVFNPGTTGTIAVLESRVSF
jgi:hypothetical protein